MTFLFIAAAAAVIGVAGVLAARAWLPAGPPEPDRAPALLPEGPLTAESLRQVRLGVALRGYRMDEVDALIARMESTLSATAPDPAPDTAPDSAQEPVAWTPANASPTLDPAQEDD